MFVDAYITQKSNFFSRKYIENTQNTLLHMVKSLSKPASVIPPLNHVMHCQLCKDKFWMKFMEKLYTRDFQNDSVKWYQWEKSDDG